MSILLSLLHCIQIFAMACVGGLLVGAACLVLTLFLALVFLAYHIRSDSFREYVAKRNEQNMRPGRDNHSVN